MSSVTRIDIEQAKLDPGAIFARPDDVLTAPGLSKGDKLTILKRWETDAEALLRAGDEGMAETAANGELVRAVQAALETLETD